MKDIIKKIVEFVKKHDTLERALQTFWQAFIAVFLVGILPVIDLIFAGDFDATKTTLYSLIIASVSSALSALKTLIKNKISK